MTKQRIRWIAVLMTVGLLGLMSLQLYWIRSALALQREQFDYKVTDALQEVVRTLERQEILYQTQQHLRQQEKERRLMAIARPQAPIKAAPVRRSRPDGPPNPAPVPEGPAVAASDRALAARQRGMPSPVSPSDVLHSDFQKLSEVQQQFMEDIIRHQDALGPEELWALQLRQQQQLDRLVDQVFLRQFQMLHGSRPVDTLASQPVVDKKAMIARKVRKPRPKTPFVAKTAPADTTSPDERFKRATRKSEMVKEVFKDLIFADRPIGSRVNRVVVDTLLKRAMQERGITIPLEYGVRMQAKDAALKPQILFASHSLREDPVQRNTTSQKLYKAVLFPNNLYEAGNLIYVYFPNQESFILQKMTMMFAGSAVLVLVIMACFYVAISTIMRQKKLADIKNDFINNMTHEFKTPISTISLAVDMANEQLLDGTAEPTRLSRYMGIIREETKRLGSHVEKVLQMALLDNAESGKGGVKLKLTEVNIHDTIGKALNTIGLQIEQKQGEVHLEFEAENEVVEADEVHLSNILYNLLDNAIKYSPEKPEITIRTKSLETGVSVTIADRGLGMTKEQLGRIFEKFYRVPTGNRHDVKGFGLGLSYVRKMVEEHHGTVQVRSQPGQGSEFEVVIPYNQSLNSRKS
ncbi:sensor histidine kinase [Tellurirhabdus rosea]|uniref:sensor histidine kinase n=1 Tax=Tellurirhabdus rosea TaxID=2674997 RepID=UPI0022592212|nr:HAMP domain-containing sensor histidine kinase [Tellurirhabdus rosea]